MDFLRYADSIQAKLHMGQVRLPLLVGMTAFALLLAGMIVAGAAGALTAPSFTVETTGDAQNEGAQAPVSASVFVHVAGAVRVQGLYELAAGSRVQQAIDAAGGFSEDAASEALNLARVVSDGEQIVVPRIASEQEGAEEGGSPASGAALQGQADGAVIGGKVNINTATADQLQTLDGIGPATAQRIIDDRAANGPFQTIEDLKRVSGIGDKKFAALSNSICVG